jgi:hypothetical protein
VSPTFWKGYSNRERHAEISNISSIISQFGDIVDFKLFSDVSISITMEVSAQNAGALLEALQDCIQIVEVTPLPAASAREITIYLNLTFSVATGNLKIEVPQVPG